MKPIYDLRFTIYVLAGLIATFCLPIAHAQLTVSVTPGYRFNNGENVTLSKLNLLGGPTVSVAGTVTGSSLAAGGVNAVNITTNALDQITILGGYDGSATTKIRVSYDDSTVGVVSNRVGLKTNGVQWVHIKQGQLRVVGLTNNWLDEVALTNIFPQTLNTNNVPYTNTFILTAVSGNVGTNGAPTNTVFTLIPFTGLINTSANTNLINMLASNLLATSYVVTNTNALAAGLVNFPHTLGTKPTRLRVTLLCVTNDTPWLVGDEVNADGVTRNGSSFANYSITVNTTNIAVRAYGQPNVVDGAASLAPLTLLNWRLKVAAEK